MSAHRDAHELFIPKDTLGFRGYPGPEDLFVGRNNALKMTMREGIALTPLRKRNLR